MPITMTKEPYGFHIEFNDVITESDIHWWVTESKYLLGFVKPGFGVVVDMTTTVTMRAKVQRMLKEGQKEFAEVGMARSAVIQKRADILGAMQLRHAAAASGIAKNERLVPAEDPSATVKAVAWVAKGVEP
jgi:hypothetical protein